MSYTRFSSDTCNTIDLELESLTKKNAFEKRCFFNSHYERTIKAQAKLKKINLGRNSVDQSIFILLN